jgi:hypothetical protein
MTFYGELKYHRTALIPTSDSSAEKLTALNGGKIVFPLDEALGVDKLPFKISIEAMLEICYWVQEVHSYEAARRVLSRNTGIRVNDDTIRAVANTIGSLVFQADSVKANEAWNLLQSGKMQLAIVKKNHDFYIETDGAMLHVRKRKDVNGSDNDSKKSIWMDNKLGMVFSSEFFHKWTDKNGEEQHKIGPREYIAYLGEVEEFKKHLLALAIRNGYGSYRQTILLSDGATWIRNMKEELFPDAQQILDFYHLSEHISTFAKELFNKNEIETKKWISNLCSLFKASKTKEAINIIENIKIKSVETIKDNLLSYIENNSNNIDYNTYINNGWYIGSGAIESANKRVVQERLKQAGMRWNRESGQWILSLMAKAKSELWNEVSDLVRSHFGVEGAFKRLWLPLVPKPKLPSNS